jgi:hypothetical protein
MSDEKGAASSAQRLTELAQRLNQLNAARFTSSIEFTGKTTSLPPHVFEKLARTKAAE